MTSFAQGRKQFGNGGARSFSNRHKDQTDLDLDKTKRRLLPNALGRTDLALRTRDLEREIPAEPTSKCFVASRTLMPASNTAEALVRSPVDTAFEIQPSQ